MTTNSVRLSIVFEAFLQNRCVVLVGDMKTLETVHVYIFVVCFGLN